MKDTCRRCGRLTSGGHERDGAGLCWCAEEAVNSEKPCPFCGTPDCPHQLYLEDKRRNPPRGVGAGLWIHGEPFRNATEECHRRKRDAKRDDQE